MGVVVNGVRISRVELVYEEVVTIETKVLVNRRTGKKKKRHRRIREWISSPMPNRVIYKDARFGCPALRVSRNGRSAKYSKDEGKFFRCVALDHRPSKSFPSSLWIDSCRLCPGATRVRNKETGEIAYKIKPRVMVNSGTGERRIWRGSVGLV